MSAVGSLLFMDSGLLSSLELISMTLTSLYIPSPSISAVSLSPEVFRPRFRFSRLFFFFWVVALARAGPSLLESVETVEGGMVLSDLDSMAAVGCGGAGTADSERRSKSPEP